MEIKDCCIDLLRGWKRETVHLVNKMTLRCETCKQKWRLKKLKEKDANNFNLISWIKIKKVNDGL